MQSHRPAALLALIQALGDADENVRANAVVALGRIGAAAVPALIAALGDANGLLVRQSTAVALERIGPAAAEAVPALIQALGDADKDVRANVALALRWIGPAAAQAVLALIQALGDADEKVRANAVVALGRIGPAAVPALIAALGDANGEFVRQSAAVALERIGPAAAEAVPALIQALGDADENVRAKAAVALGRIGPAAAEAVPALIQALGDADENVRAKGAVALGGIGPAAVPALIAALGDANENIRESAAWALGKIGPAAAEAVPALIAALGDTDKDVRAKAIAALRWIGPAAVPALIQALSSADENVRANAVRALEKRRLASPDRSPTTAAEAVVEAVLMLIAALGDADKDVRANAAKALTAIEPMAAAVRQSTAEATAAPRGTTVVPGAEPVDTAVFCPPRVKKESVFLVQVFLYPPGAEDKVDDQARKMDEAAEHRGTYSLPLDLPPNTRVDLRLEIPNLTVTEADAVLVWRGRPTAAQFEVTVPAAAPGTEAIGRVRFAVAGVPAGTIRFKVALAASGTLERAALPEVEAVRYRRAFVSYSSQDRAEVLRRVQAFRIAGLSVFRDILDLEPGERWARALYREIDKCDVFLLFWSRAAAASEWVAREIAYALKVKAGNDDRPPAIQPVPIEGPPPPPAPETLRHLHFNDALLAHIQAADARPVSNGG